MCCSPGPCDLLHSLGFSPAFGHLSSATSHQELPYFLLSLQQTPPQFYLSFLRAPAILCVPQPSLTSSMTLCLPLQPATLTSPRPFPFQISFLLSCHPWASFSSFLPQGLPLSCSLLCTSQTFALPQPPEPPGFLPAYLSQCSACPPNTTFPEHHDPQSWLSALTEVAPGSACILPALQLSACP